MTHDTLIDARFGSTPLMTSLIRVSSNGSMSWFPFAEPAQLRTIHFTIHSGVRELWVDTETQTIAEAQRAMRRVIPYRVHVKVGRERFPRTSPDIAEVLGLWNHEEWGDEEFLWIDLSSLSMPPGIKDLGSMTRVTLDMEDVLRRVVRSVRVVGGREVELARDSGAIRRGAVFHPTVGFTSSYPIVVRSNRRLLSGDDFATAVDVEKMRMGLDDLAGRLGLIAEASIGDRIRAMVSENSDLVGFLLREASRVALGEDIAEPLPIWSP